MFPKNLSEQLVGTTVPTKIVGTPNGGFLLAVPTNLSEQTTIYNFAMGTDSVDGGGTLYARG